MIEDPVLAFARDFSGRDPAVIAAARSFVADPPTETEAIGYYGMKAAPPRTRAFLATVSLLDRKGFLYSAEDKYSYEIYARWRDDGIVDPASLSSAAKALFQPWMQDDDVDLSGAAGEAYAQTVWSLYAKAAAELEQHIASRGRVLLSVDATSGDTLHFALVPPAVAHRWRDKALSEHDGYRAGVRSPMWDRFFDHMAYAVGDLWSPRGQRGYPPGTRVRNEAIPFAE